MSERTSPADSFEFQKARVEDAAAIWRLVGSTGVLEQNTPYAYLLLCSHFAETCVVARTADELLGVVLAYRLPAEPNVVFVWQVGVSPLAQGQGLGRALLDALVRQPGCQGVDTLSATVAPDNTASMALFSSFARHHGAPLTQRGGYPAELFPGEHADEPEVRIGPFDVHSQPNET